VQLPPLGNQNTDEKKNVPGSILELVQPEHVPKTGQETALPNTREIGVVMRDINHLFHHGLAVRDETVMGVRYIRALLNPLQTLGKQKQV
jgi:hypothetical protein